MLYFAEDRFTGRHEDLMRTFAILPMKGFGAAKGRLAEALPPGSRQALARAMFGDVVANVRRAQRLEGLILVTGDTQVAAAASADGLDVVRDPLEQGQSAAAELGIARAVQRGAERVVLVPGDTPLLDCDELDGVLDRAEVQGLGAAIVPDRHATGTNALVLAPPNALRPSFGPGSLERHVSEASAAGLANAVESVRSLALDVDTPDDLATLAVELERGRSLAPLTRGAVRQLARFGRLPRPPANGSSVGAAGAVEA
jgi:2-phospho-L-lactate guanylyltransferase